MRLPRSTSRRDGLVWIEVLVILLVLMLLVAVMIPYLEGGGPSKGVACMSQQKQIALGFTLWDSDNSGKYPWQVPATNHGAMEASAQGDAAASFKTLHGYIQPEFVCPTDPARTATTNITSLTAQNLSYFIGYDGFVRSTNARAGILTGDRHIRVDGTPVNPGLFTYTNNMPMGWTTELHRLAAAPMGVLSFYDGHCEVVNNTNIDVAFERRGLASSRYAIP